MARRKRHCDDREHTDRWLISYADFITLLLAFFIVMYAVSSVNEGKYRVLSQHLGSAFAERRVPIDPIPIGEPERSNQLLEGGGKILAVEPKTPVAAPKAPSAEPGQPAEAPAPDPAVEAAISLMKRVSQRLNDGFAPYIDQDLIAIKREDVWIKIELKSGILFGSGTADLAEEALPILAKLADILKDIPNPVQVEGHTDNVPIQNPKFPSNWELSAARAASVVRHFVNSGVDPAKMAAVGYAEFQPIADNRFEEGRLKNRRVVLMLMSQGTARPQDAAGEHARLLTPTLAPKPQ